MEQKANASVEQKSYIYIYIYIFAVELPCTVKDVCDLTVHWR